MKNTRKKRKVDRWNEAQKSLKRFLEEIAPFRKEKPQLAQSTEGLWDEASSITVSEDR